MNHGQWKWGHMKSNNECNFHCSLYESKKSWVSWYGPWRVSSIPYGSALRSPAGSPQQIHTKSWRTANVSSSARGKPGGTVPLCNASSSKRWAVVYYVCFFRFYIYFPSIAQLLQVTNWTCFSCSHLYFDLPGCSHIAYFCVQSLANLLYLRKNTKRFH